MSDPHSTALYPIYLSSNQTPPILLLTDQDGSWKSTGSLGVNHHLMDAS
jgi:hypothetical protein